MASTGELVTVLTETIAMAELPAGVIDRAPTLGLLETATGTSPNIVFDVSWDEGTKTDSMSPENALLLREPTPETKLLLNRVMQPKGGGIVDEPGDTVLLPSRSTELRGVVVGAFLAQFEDGTGVVQEDIGQVVLIRVGVPPVDQEVPDPGGAWYFAKVSDMVVVPNA